MKIILSLLFIVISLSFANTAGKGELCDYFHLCNGGLSCSKKCYSDKDLLLAKTDISFSPQGPDCDFFKWCPKGMTCKGKCIEIKKKYQNQPPQEKTGLLQQAKQDQQQKPTAEMAPKADNKTTQTPPPKQKEMYDKPQVANSNTTDDTKMTARKA